jgi:lysophospholipase L1-like esterase
MAKPGIRPARRTPLRAARDSLLVLAITIGLTLGLLEIGLRLVAPQIPPWIGAGLYVPDRAARYRNAPHAAIPYDSHEIHTVYRINGQGLRADQDYGPPAPDRFRLLVLGDSMTFGVGVNGDQAYPALLNGSHAADGRLVESLNAGVCGYGTDNEVAWLHAYGWAFKPDMLLVGFYVGNDVRDVMLGMDKTALGDDTGTDVSAQVQQARDRLHARSDAETWLSYNSHAYLFLQRALAPLAPPPARPPDLFDNAYIYLNPEPAELATGWEQATSLLDELRWKAEQHGVPLVVVAIPAREQVVDRYWRESRAALGLKPDAVDRDAPQKRLAAWSARTGAPLIDLLPGIRAAGGDRYLHTDPHLNASGQALAAELIRAELIRRGLFR